MLEAIALCERIAGRPLRYTLLDEPRVGDHMWWISDLDAFKRDHPGWELTFGIEDVLRDIHDRNVEHWRPEVRGPRRPAAPRG
jgi:CDP-paratose 2-epimerase